MGNASSIQWVPDRRTGRFEPVVVRHRVSAKKQPRRPPSHHHLDTWNDAERRERGEHIPHDDLGKNVEKLLRDLRARLMPLSKVK